MKTETKTVHIYSSMPLQVPAPRKPGDRRAYALYKTVQGYSEVYPDNGISSPLRLRNWQAMARRAGTKLKVWHTEDAARKAAGI